MERVLKTDLHIHLGGSWPLPFLRSIGSLDEIAELESFLKDIDSKSNTDYHSTFNAFSLSAKIVNSNDRIRAGTAAVCQKMSAEGVVYSEIRTSLKDFGTGLEDYLTAVLEGVRDGCRCSDLDVKIILSLKRSSTVAIARETLRLLLKYRTQGVVGLDISDNALLGDGSGIFSIIDEVHANSIPVALHLGECSEETGDQQISELTRLKPRRIGHGVFLCDRAKEWIYERMIPIEMCLSSALKAHMVDSMREHPALDLLRSGYPVAVCTDDPLIFGTDHIKENQIAMELLGYSFEQFEALHTKSLSYKFG